MADVSPCNGCDYATPIAYDTHIRCTHPLVLKWAEEPPHNIYTSIGRLAKGRHIIGQIDVMMKMCMNGHSALSSWPYNFDSTFIIKCDARNNPHHTGPLQEFNPHEI